MRVQIGRSCEDKYDMGKKEDRKKPEKNEAKALAVSAEGLSA